MDPLREWENMRRKTAEQWALDLPLRLPGTHAGKLREKSSYIKIFEQQYLSSFVHCKKRSSASNTRAQGVP